jgi:hypothetical protein
VIEEPDELEVLPAGQQIIDGGVLAGEADHRPDRPGVLLDVKARHPGTAAVGLEQGGKHPDQGNLASAVRAEKSQDLARLNAEQHVIESQRAPEPFSSRPQPRPRHPCIALPGAGQS